MEQAGDQTEAKRLTALREAGLLSSPALPELNEICRQAKERLRAAVAMVTLVGQDDLIVRGRAGTTLEGGPRRYQFCDETIKSDDVLVVPDATLDPRFATNPLVTGNSALRFYAGAPLIYRDGIRLGALCVLDPKPRELSLGEQAELQMLADEVVSFVIRSEIENGSRRAGL